MPWLEACLNTRNLSRCAVKRLPLGGRYQAQAAKAAILKHIASHQGFRYLRICEKITYTLWQNIDNLLKWIMKPKEFDSNSLEFFLT